MLDDRQIHEAFAADAERAKLPADLLGRIQRDLAGGPRKAPWWRRMRLAHWLEVAAVCVVMVGALVLLAGGQQGRPPAGERSALDEPVARLSIANVVRAYRVQPGPGGRKRDADLTNPTDRQQVQRLLDAIASAESINPTGANSYNPRVRQGSLHIELRSGEHMIVRPAMNCDGPCQTTNDKQVIAEGPNPDESKGRVVASSELASILRSPEWPQGVEVWIKVDAEQGRLGPQNQYGVVPGALVEVLELGVSKRANEGGELTLRLPPGVFTFRVTVEGSPYETVSKKRIKDDNGLVLTGLSFNPLGDHYAWEDGLTPPAMKPQN